MVYIGLYLQNVFYKYIWVHIEANCTFYFLKGPGQAGGEKVRCINTKQVFAAPDKDQKAHLPISQIYEFSRTKLG